MKNILLFVSIIFSIHSYSQINFEKGYYIDNSNQRTDCLIKNSDWKNNPIDFEYRLSDNSEPKTATLDNVKEFGISTVSKYVRSTTNIDRSPGNINLLSTDKNPEFKEETIFLKVLVEGKSTLYQYIDGSLSRYFYKKDDSNIEQLVFKNYKTPENKVGENNEFRQQLWNNLKCSDIPMSKFNSIYYKKNDLVRFFIEYSNCNNQDVINYETTQNRDLFNLSIRPRINSSSLTVQNSQTSTRDTDFGNKVGFGIGLEAEYILPFNKNKWAMVIEPSFQSFKSSKTSDVANVVGGKLIAEVDYSSIELPISIRHYFFLNNTSKIFVNASYIFDFSSNSTVDFKRADSSSINSLDIETLQNYAIGLGFKAKDKLALELRYQTSRNVLGGYTYWYSDYNTLSLIIGYSLFKK